MTKIVALLGGGDWADASVSHLVIPDDMNLDEQKRAYGEWYANFRLGGKYVGFYEYLLEHGARKVTEDEVIEYWEY